MTDIPALMNVLPISTLEPDWIAILDGLAEKSSGEALEPSIWILEPPAGQQVPFIDPVKMMSMLFRHEGMDIHAAMERATSAYAKLRPRLALPQRVRFYDSLEPDSPECIPLPTLIDFLHEKSLVSEALTTYLDRIVDTVISVPLFRGPDNWDSPWTLSDLPDLPPPKAMIVFFPGPSWEYGDDTAANMSFFRSWREWIRPIAENLEKVLGEPVYYFADPECDTDDDDVHRFLVLHWCCTYKPESAFVKFLIEATKSKDVHELKNALIDPKSYFHPFKMNDAFIGLEACGSRFNYIAPNQRRTVGIVFSTLVARERATSLMLQCINTNVVVLAPKELATDEWIASAARHCRDWTLCYVCEGRRDAPIEFLSRVDELYMVCDEKMPGRGFDLHITPANEDLLWRAHILGVSKKFYDIDGCRHGNPETSLEKSSAPTRVAEEDIKREAFTKQLSELRIDAEYGSSGLWDGDGRMIAYDLLALPFALVRRLSAWQLDFEETNDPPRTGDDAWWDKFDAERMDIARELQAFVGTQVKVKIFRQDGWKCIGDVSR